MNRLRRKVKEFVWVALLAFAGLAVAPTISRAIHMGAELEEPAGTSSNAPMAAMGSEHAHHHAVPSTEPSQHSGGHSHSLAHCAMCVVAACAYALGPTAPSVATSPVVHEDVHLSVGATPRLRQDWLPAGPRGPPVRA